MKRFFTLTMVMCLVLSALMANDYQTAGDGTVYSFQSLANIEGSGVTAEGSTYTLNGGSLVISDGDSFKLDEGSTIVLTAGSTINFLGDADFSVEKRTKFTWDTESANVAQIQFRKENAKYSFKNVDFEYQGIIFYTKSNIEFDSCRFTKYVYINKVTAPVRVAVTDSKIKFLNCYFGGGSQYSCYTGAANINVSSHVEGCTFDKSQQTNRNQPMLNLQQGDSIIVRKNVFIGDPTKNMVGALSVSNMLGADGANYVLIEENVIDSCRYGINIQGKFKEAIIRNNVIRHNKYVYQNNANNGGSGIAVYDSSKSLNLKISGNHIEDNLWGVTIMGGGEVNLGKIEIDGTPLNSDAKDYNAGGNVFIDNGNNGILYDLAFASGTSYLTVYAQNNTWNADEQTKEKIEEVILHQADNSNLGKVIFMPAKTTTTAIGNIAVNKNVSDKIYNIYGQRIETPQKGQVYIQNGKKVVYSH